MGEGVRTSIPMLTNSTNNFPGAGGSLDPCTLFESTPELKNVSLSQETPVSSTYFFLSNILASLKLEHYARECQLCNFDKIKKKNNNNKTTTKQHTKTFG